MLSTKRNHASILADTTDPSSTTDNDKSEAKLTHTLSKSLKEILLPNNNLTSTENEKDVYHQYLNSPPPNTTNDNTNEQNKKIIELQTWLTNSMTSVGVGSNFNTIKFWKEHINGAGNNSSDNLTELYADGRYLVWFVKEILLPAAAANSSMNDDASEGDVEKDTTTDSSTEQLLEIINEWHLSIHQLLSLNSTKASEDEEFNNNEEEDEDDDMTAGVMWQMLVQSSNLTPESIRETLDVYTSPQTGYEKSINGGDGDNVALPGECFAWPSFFQHVTSQAQQSSNKRRRSNTSKSLSINNSNKSRKNHESWYPLLGYAITYAFLSCNNGMTVQQKISHLKNNLLDSLPYMLGIPNFDYNTKHLLCSGIVGCVLDEVGEWIVLDGLVLGEEGGGIINGNDEEESNKQWRASVSQVVELLTVDGVLAKLAKVTNTPLSNLVAEVADSLMLYSKVYQGLRSNQGSKDINGEDVSHLINDTMQIASFIEKADPQLTLQLASQKFISSQYYSPGIDSAAPVHPIVIYTRALLFANSLVQASKLCRTLEDCVGIDNATKEHCYFLLFEKFQDLGVLFEDGWDTATKEEGGSRATLANITLGALGLKCAQNYLEHVVITAQDTLLSKPVQNSCLRRHKERAKQELLCVKDAVRRTVLKFLIPRAYSPHEALITANKLSLANSAPRLENVTLSNDTTVDAVYHIFATPTLYSIWNENLLSDEEEEEEAKEDSGPEETENIDLEQEEEEVVEPEEQAKDVPSPEEEENINEEEPRGAVQADEKDDDNEVIDLGDDTDEEEEVTTKQQQQSDAAESNDDEEEQVDSVDEEDLAEEQQDDITYPRHYQQFAGNYSESDDYDAEDNEEADRHLAFEGMHDDQEGQGGSDNEEHDEGQTIELLDSSADEDENEQQQEEEMMKRAEDESSEEGNDSDETGALNEAVDKYIAKQEGKEHVESDDNDPANESNDKTEQGDEALHDSSEEQQELEAKILSEAVHEYINPSTGAKEDVNDSIGEEHGREKNDSSNQHDIGVSEKEEGTLASIEVEVQKQTVEGQADEAGSPSKTSTSPAIRRSTRDRKPSPKKRAAMESSSATAASEDKKTEPVGSKNDESSQHDVDVNEKGTDVIGNNDAEKTSVLEEGEDGDKNDESNKNEANEPTVEDGTELYDLLADDEHESIDTEDDKRSVSQEQLEPEVGDNIKDDANNNMEKEEDLSARISKYMSPKYQAEKEAEESPLKRADGNGDKVEVENEGEKQPSVLVAAAMSTQRQGNNFDQSSTPNRFELPPEGFEGAEEDDDDEAQSVDGNDNVSSGHTSAARASTDNDSLVVGEAAMTDDGYVPDDAETEVERADRAKKESIRKKAIDDGYVPDASEASEVEQSEAAIPDSNTKRRSAVRDVRFETDLETKINDAVVPGIDGVAASQSIDDGYLPDESEVERGETLKRRTQQGIDQGYLPDGHTTPGDATEEDHGEDDAAVGGDVAAKDDSQKKSSDVMDVDTDNKDVASQSKVATDVAMPVETRLDDTIDEGYLPSAGEQELSEKEEVTLATTNEEVVQEQQVLEEPVKEGETPSVRQSSRDRKPSPKKKAAIESSFATNKLVQEQQVGEQAKEAGTPLNMDSSSTVRRSTRDRKPSPKKMAAMESSSASVNDKKTETIQEGTLEKKSPAKASIEKATAEYWNEVNEKSTLQESETKQDDLSKEIAVQQEDASAESNKSEPVKDPLQEPAASKEAITQASPLDTAAIDAAVEACNNINAADITSPNPTNEAVGADTTTAASQQREDLSILTVVQLKDRLRGLNLAVGGRKQELIDRLNGHLYPNLTENEQVEDVPLANQDEKQAQAESTVSTRRSRRGKKPSAKAAPEKQQDTPISELSHPVDSETDDDDDNSVQKKHFTSSSQTAETDSKPSPGVPSSIVTRRGGKKKSSPSLPVVPEGETVEDSQVEGPKVAVKLVDEEASKRSTRSTRSTRQSKKKNDEAADNDTTTSVSTRGSRRIAAQKKSPSDDTTSKRSTRSRQTASTKESSPPKRRSGRAKKGAEESVSTRGSKRVAASMDTKADTTEKAPPAKRRSGRSRKTETEEESASSSRRSTRRTTATKTDESVGTRRSTRRSKK